MSILNRLLTYDDLLQMPDDGYRYEIIDGDLLMSPAPNRKHQKLLGKIYRLMFESAEAEGLGEVYFAPVDVHLSPHRIVQPDLLFLRWDRRHLFGPRGVEGPPDLVVEILSPSSRANDLVRKFQIYAEAGVPEYWAVDPDLKILRIFVLQNGRYEEQAQIGGRLQSTVLPGLAIDVTELFAGLD